MLTGSIRAQFGFFDGASFSQGQTFFLALVEANGQAFSIVRASFGEVGALVAAVGG
jgi:hypothetical protein